MLVKGRSSSVTNTNPQVTKTSFVPSVFKCVHALLLLGGIYPGFRGTNSTNHRKRSWLKKAYVVTILMVYVVQLSLFVHAMYTRALNGQDLTKLVTFCLIMALNIPLALTSAATLPKQLAKLERSLQRYENQCGFSIHVTKWLRIIRVIVVINIVYIIVAGLMITYNLMNYRELKCEVFPLCDVKGSWQYVLFAFNTLQIYAVGAMWQGYLIVSIFFSVLLLEEFKAINSKFQKLTESPTCHVESRLEGLVDHHESVADILNIANKCTCHFSFFGLFISLPSNCSFIYSTLFKSASTSEMEFLCFCIVASMSTVGLRLFIEACVGTQAHEPLQHTWKLQKAVLSNQGTNNLNLFVSRLTSDSIGYNIYGLLNINMPTLLGIFGTFATYIIIVIQFHPTDTSLQCELFMRNRTLCVTS